MGLPSDNRRTISDIVQAIEPGLPLHITGYACDGCHLPKRFSFVRVAVEPQGMWADPDPSHSLKRIIAIVLAARIFYRYRRLA